MDLDNLSRIYFIGIGGIGMSALARYFNSKGVAVSGYDRVITDISRQLEKEGMTTCYEDDVKSLPEKVDLVVYTPAIPKDHSQLNYFLNNNYPVMKRAEVLEELSKDKFTIAVAGSHGKTTVSTMIAHILKDTEFDCTAFLGGISVNYQSNFIPGKNEVMVIEADEFDRSFLKLSPDIAVITAVDTDHLDVYGNKENIEEAFLQFAGKIKEGGVLVANSGLDVLSRIENRRVIRYSLHDLLSEYYISNLSTNDSGYLFDIVGKDFFAKDLILKMGGRHNVENALAAYIVARVAGVDPIRIKEALISFKGIKRRFEYLIKSPALTFIDDYAHHPEEIRSLLNSARELYPGRKLTVIFQPHLFSRTNDLYQEFARVLDNADEVILLPIYPAREKPLPDVTSGLILNELQTPNKHLVEKEDLLNMLEERPLEVLLTVGAGDIDTLVLPLKRLLEKQLTK